jgi:regulation of enolase protein 1 (concanavalin A-like superfamily)
VALTAGTATRAQTTPNYIQIENAKPGAADWKLTKPGYATGVIEGYASAASVNRGETIRIYVNTREPSYTMDVYRMGYYGGAGARRMLTVTLAGTSQPACPLDAFGMVECRWANPYLLSIPASSDPTDWMSGMYVVKLTSGTTKTQQYVLFTVRDDLRFSDMLMIQSVNTYQAYNVWGGKSLYGTLAVRDDTANKAVKVSFNRPYYADGGYGSSSFFSADYQGHELNMLTWLEKEGYDVSYATDVDVDDNPNALLNHKLIQIVGHSEYWSWAMRDNVDRAIQAGVSFASVAGNVSFWQIRYETSPATGDPSRTMVGYKELIAQDPLKATQYATTEWRFSPVNRSEDRMTGTMFVTQARPPLCIEDESHWLLAGTGLKNGQCLRNPDGSTFLGYEIDSMGPATPSAFPRVGHSPATPDLANFADMGVWRAASGATIFTTGSIGWSEALPQTQQILRNVYARMLKGAFAETTPIRPVPPAPFRAQDVGNVARPGFVALAGPASFRLNGDGLNMSVGDDGFFYVYQAWTGDGRMTLRLKTLQEYWGNQAGIMIRESLDPKSRYVSLAGRPSEGMVAGADFRVKAAYGALPKKISAIDQAAPNWLQLVRIGSAFYAFASQDGINWTPLGSTTLGLTGSVLIGAYVASAQPNVWMTADFDQVSVSGDTTLPAVPPPPPPPPPAPALPSGWASRDIGTVGIAGSSSYDVASSAFIVKGAGADIWNSADAFQFAYTTLTGDGSIVARVRSVSAEAAWVKVGVMLRETLDPSSKHGLMLVSNTKGLAFQRRATTAGPSANTAGGAFAAPRWVRLDRVGSAIRAYQSADGASWTLVGSDTISMASQVYAGLAVSSHTTSALATGLVDSVSVVAAQPPPNPPAPGACASVTLSRTLYYSGAPASNWSVSVTAPDASCTWTASVDQPWILLNGKPGPASMSGAGSTIIKVGTLDNKTGAMRYGTFTIAGTNFKVTQEY